MAVTRVKIPHVGRRIAGPVAPGSELYVYQRGTTTQVDVFAAASGGSPLTQPLLANSEGEWNGYTAPAQLDLKAVIDTVPNTVEWDPTPGGALHAKSEPTMRFVRGQVSTTTPTIDEGSGFSLTRHGVGDVTITFAEAFSDLPTPTFGVAGTTFAFAFVDSITTSTMRIKCLNTAGSALERTFYFQVAGPS